MTIVRVDQSVDAFTEQVGLHTDRHSQPHATVTSYFSMAQLGPTVTVKGVILVLVVN